jgi:Fe-S cluster biogenesis protein NfuA
MHGGSAAIRDLDPETGNAWTQLSGYRGGSGIASRTTLALRSCLPMDLAGMTEVHIDTA